MPQCGGTRLGGEFQVGDVSVRGRKLFFEAFARLHPEAVEALQRLAEDSGNDDTVDDFCQEYHLWWIPLEEWLNPDEQAQHDWLRLGVRDTVRVWRASSWARTAAAWMIRRPPPMTGDETSVPEAEYLYRLSQSLIWEPLEETESEFRAKVETYIEHRKREYEERDGVQLAPTMRDIRSPYEWTVRFYVDGHSYPQLAVSLNKDVDSVRKAVRKISDQIGLPRPGSGRRYPPT